MLNFGFWILDFGFVEIVCGACLTGGQKNRCLKSRQRPFCQLYKLQSLLAATAGSMAGQQAQRSRGGHGNN